jgi:hypothetical protein
MVESDTDYDGVLTYGEYITMLKYFSVKYYNGCSVMSSKITRLQFDMAACSCMKFEAETTSSAPDHVTHCNCGFDDNNANIVLPGVYPFDYTGSICEAIVKLLKEECTMDCTPALFVTSETSHPPTSAPSLRVASGSSNMARDDVTPEGKESTYSNTIVTMITPAILALAVATGAAVVVYTLLTRRKKSALGGEDISGASSGYTKAQETTETEIGDTEAPDIVEDINFKELKTDSPQSAAEHPGETSLEMKINFKSEQLAFVVQNEINDLDTSTDQEMLIEEILRGSEDESYRGPIDTDDNGAIDVDLAIDADHARKWKQSVVAKIKPEKRISVSRHGKRSPTKSREAFKRALSQKSGLQAIPELNLTYL